MQELHHVSFPGLGIQDLPVSRVALRLNLFGQEIPIYWYGILIAAAMIFCLFLAFRKTRAYNLLPDDILDVFLCGIPLGFLGARLYYVIFSWPSFRENLIEIVRIRNGGIAFYGGVLGSVLAVILVCRHKGIRTSHMLDFLVPYLALGQAIGRWGNFFNQEAFGGNTLLPWGMISESTQHFLEKLGPPFAANSPVHPTFFYEFVGNLLIFFILRDIRKKSDFRFETTAWYFLLYGILRFFVEGLRTDPLLVLGGRFRVSQLFSAAMFCLAFIYLLSGYLRRRSQPDYLSDPFGWDALERQVEADLAEEKEERKLAGDAEAKAEAVPQTVEAANASGADKVPSETAETVQENAEESSSIETGRDEH